MRAVLIQLWLLITLSIPPLAAQTEAKSWSIRVAALDIAGAFDTLWLRTGPGEAPVEISLNTRIFSQVLEFKGPAALQLFGSAADAAAEEPPAPLASTVLSSDSSLLVFLPRQDQNSYDTFAIADSDFPFGSFRLINLSRATVRAELGAKPIVLRPNAAETVVFRGGQTATPVRIHALAEGTAPRLIRQSSWSIVPTQRELVLFFPNPASGLVRLRHFVDTEVEDPAQ